MSYKALVSPENASLASGSTLSVVSAAGVASGSAQASALSMSAFALPHEAVQSSFQLDLVGLGMSLPRSESFEADVIIVIQSEYPHISAGDAQKYALQYIAMLDDPGFSGDAGALIEARLFDECALSHELLLSLSPSFSISPSISPFDESECPIVAIAFGLDRPAPLVSTPRPTLALTTE
jgi:hypothetical protein